MEFPDVWPTGLTWITTTNTFFRQNRAYVGTSFDEVNIGKAAVYHNEALKLDHVPFTRTENFCATGVEALRGRAMPWLRAPMRTS